LLNAFDCPQLKNPAARALAQPLSHNNSMNAIAINVGMNSQRIICGRLFC